MSPGSKSKKASRFGASIIGIAKAPGVFWSFSKLGFQKKSAKFVEGEDSMQGKTVVITGANSGLGRSAADSLIALGAKVWILCRNRERGEKALGEIRSHSRNGGSAHLAIVDMSDLSSIRSVVDSIRGSKVDVLIHNAGSLCDEHVITPEGLEFDFALHLAGPHLLTKLLSTRLKAGHGRVLFVSSGGMYTQRFSMSATNWAHRPYDGARAYAVVKRGQVILSSLWALQEPGIGFHSMHPGWVNTPGVETSLPAFHKRMRRWLRTPAQGADTIVWLASTASIPAASGEFWLDRSPVSTHIIPGTQESAVQREALWDSLEAVTRQS